MSRTTICSLLIITAFGICATLSDTYIGIPKFPAYVKSCNEQECEHLINNAEFTNQTWTYDQVKNFYNSWKKNRFTDEEIRFMVYSCREFKIHPLVQAAKLEQENGLVRNVNTSGNRYSVRRFRAMAYGLTHKTYPNGKKHYTHGGFYKQIYRGTRCLRKWFDYYYVTKNKNQKINYDRKKIRPHNASTYSLFVYCPFYGKYNNYNKICRGNEVFQNVYREFRHRWNDLIIAEGKMEVIPDILDCSAEIDTEEEYPNK